MGGSILQISTLMNLSKHLLTLEVRATGRQPFGHVTLLFFGTGMMTDDLKQMGTMPVERERLKMFVNTPASWVSFRSSAFEQMHSQDLRTSSDRSMTWC